MNLNKEGAQGERGSSNDQKKGMYIKNKTEGDVSVCRDC